MNRLDWNITKKAILKFTLPSIVMMVIMSLYTVVDGVFVSRLIGTDAFSAINIVYPMNSIVIGIGTMLGTGITAIVSVKLGEKKEEEARRNFSFITLATILTGLALSAAGILFLEELIMLQGANEAIYGYCYAYALPLVLFFPASLLQLLFQIIYVADGKPQIGLMITIAGGVANIILDYVFIAIAGMGIAGAAVATGIGYLLPALFGLLYFGFKRKGNLYFVKPKADWKVLIHTSTNGSSEMVNNLSTSVTTFLFNLILMRLAGQDGVAAIAILLYLDFVLIAIGLGYSIGIAPLFSYHYGSGNHGNLQKLYRFSMQFCIVVGGVMTFGTVLGASQLSAIFAHKGSAVYELARAGLSIYAFSYLFKGINVFASALFTAFGNGKISALLSFARTLVLLVVCLLAFSALFGIDGVWYAPVVAEGLALCMSLFFMAVYRKKYHYLPELPAFARLKSLQTERNQEKVKNH